MNNARFRFSASILKRLGEELNPSPDQSILELVKNAYDANARSCTVELAKTDKPGGSIRIADTGDGMDASEIIEGWLVLGKSTKSPTKRTRLGRIPAGSKGLGRLAALRMGKTVVLKTRPLTDPSYEYSLIIDWSKFDDVDLVDEVSLQIGTHRNLSESESGTEIILEDLRSDLSRNDVQRLSRSLILLADPFGDDPDAFKPVLKAKEFEDLERLVQTRYFQDAEYHLIGRVDGNGKARATVVDFQGRQLFSASHGDISEVQFYGCPKLTFDLWVFILDAATFSTRSSKIKEVRQWLQTFGGVHLYENSLRVSPYGNPGNDWLDMNLARVKSPEERPGTNTSIGRILVSDDKRMLLQKTDRSGFIETEDFLEIKRFAKDALDWMARRRMEEAVKRRTKERTEGPSRSQRAKASVNNAIEKIHGKPKGIVQLAFKKYDYVRQKEIRSLQQEVQLYRTLSTAGITAETFAHESAANPLKVITYAIKTIERRGRKHLGQEYDSTIGNQVSTILRSTDSLKVLGNVTMSLLDHEKRRLTRVDIHDTILRVVEMFRPFLDERHVKVIPQFEEGSPYLRGSEAAVESIITNLINNSVVWLEGNHSGHRQIIVRTRFAVGIISIRVMDNGPGIKNISKNDIWLPGESTRPNGTGLGLTIVHDTVNDLGGNVDALENGEIGGAEVIIELPILGT